MVILLLRKSAVPIALLLGVAATVAEIPEDPGQAFKECPDCPEMVSVPDGSFTQ